MADSREATTKTNIQRSMIKTFLAAVINQDAGDIVSKSHFNGTLFSSNKQSDQPTNGKEHSFHNPPLNLTFIETDCARLMHLSYRILVILGLILLLLFTINNFITVTVTGLLEKNQYAKDWQNLANYINVNPTVIY